MAMFAAMRRASKCAVLGQHHEVSLPVVLVLTILCGALRRINQPSRLAFCNAAIIGGEALSWVNRCRSSPAEN